MTVRQYFEVARERWRFVLAGVLAGLAAAVALTVLMPREYSADVTIFVSAQSAGADTSTALEGSQLSAQRMRTYVELLGSRRLATEVVATMELPVTGDDLAARITASSAPETALLTATVTDGTPQGAVDIANTVADKFIEEVADLEQPTDTTTTPVVAAKVFQEAAPPADLVAPRPVLYLGAGLGLGLLAGLAGALLRNALDTSIRRRRRLAEVLGVPVLGAFGRGPSRSANPLVVHDDPRSPLAEAVRQVRTNLRFADEREPRIVVVTSPSEGEGKTTTVAGLGLAVAAGGKRVLLVEADLRRPRLADLMGVDPGPGLVAVLDSGLPLTNAIRYWGAELDVLPAGPVPDNPSELLGSRRMADVLDEARGTYDMVLVDVPPLLPVTDAAVVASGADGVILVVRHGRTTENHVLVAKQAIDAVSARLLGSVLTMVPRAGTRRYQQRAYGRGASRTDPSRAVASRSDSLGSAAPGAGSSTAGRSSGAAARPGSAERPPFGTAVDEQRTREHHDHADAEPTNGVGGVVLVADDERAGHAAAPEQGAGGENGRTRPSPRPRS